MMWLLHRKRQNDPPITTYIKEDIYNEREKNDNERETKNENDPPITTYIKEDIYNERDKDKHRKEK